MVTTREKADELGLTPLVRLVSWAVAGVPPDVMGIGPVPATEVALAKAGLRLADIDLIELNEAFAAQAIAVMREWKFSAADRDRTNVHGSGISLGHPVGATGARMLATLARELNRRQARYGLETMCIGGAKALPRSSNGSPPDEHAVDRRHRCRGVQLRRGTVVRYDVESAGRTGDSDRSARRCVRCAPLAAGKKRYVDLLDRPEQGKALGDYRPAFTARTRTGPATGCRWRRHRGDQRRRPVLAVLRAAGQAAIRCHPRPVAWPR
ncbi:thiolase, C-terminal domain protein [Mycobacterium xenopi 4042]|uniref:Thiolase, C-terminal domain protein n=1 Tax=Mycobacterium xenopi 4042 TaxID=1299334 RepID=X8E693_MYCXE|nr:thiolase, C-terminal domain protein [Mycobacterium xenopi 4042]